MLKHYLTSVSYQAMSLSLMLYQEQDDRFTQRFMKHEEATRKHTLQMTFRGRPHQPMFRPTHHIKPANWNEEAP